MGPTVLLDKCAFQSLSRHELRAISRCFYINLPPILTLEILADLKKLRGLMIDNKHEVQVLSEKMLTLSEAFHNTHYRIIAEGETQGCPVEIRGVTVMGGGKRKELPGGKFGVIFDEHPDRARFRNWASGRFSEQDEQHAQKWRDNSTRVNVEAIRKDLWSKVKGKVKGLPAPASMSETLTCVDEYLKKASQLNLLHSLIDILGLNETMRTKAVALWHHARATNVQNFAPFGFHVLRTIHLYMIGLAYGLIGNKATNLVDLDYLFYLPFCRVFSTGDKFLSQMAEALIGPGQVCFDRDSLKRDMRAVHDYYECDQESQEARVKRQEIENLLVHPVWRINLPPWKRQVRNLASEMSDEAKKKLLNRFKAMLD